MDRYNSEGILRRRLPDALRDAMQVKMALKIDRCLLCRRTGVNQAGLCDVCMTLLTDEEASIVQRWLIGVAP